jgi:hypothetical protein
MLDVALLMREWHWRTLLERQIDAHAALEAQDLRKLAHQAICGPGHAITSAAAALERLQHEVTTMGSGAPAPLLEPIAPDGSMVRIHLRPFVSLGGDLTVLCDGFVRSAEACHESAASLHACLQPLTTALRALSLPLHDTWVMQLPAWASAGYPPVHHSPRYEAAERPAYRVLTATVARAVLDRCRLGG